jgi:hypothetical protein
MQKLHQNIAREQQKGRSNERPRVISECHLCPLGHLYGYLITTLEIFKGFSVLCKQFRPHTTNRTSGHGAGYRHDIRRRPLTFVALGETKQQKYGSLYIHSTQPEG